METLFTDPAIVWLAAGAFFIAFEAFTIPGIGLFLAGLGAITTGLLIKSGLVSESASLAQFAWFFAATCLWTIALWKPLQKFRVGRKGGHALEPNNMVGSMAIVGTGGLKKGVIGQVIWSGTVMSAELDAHASADSLPAGVQVRVKSVSGTTLTVTS